MLYVMRGGDLEVDESKAFLLVALGADGALELVVEGSLTRAAKAMSERLGGAATCEPGLTLPGRPFGWTPRPPTDEQLEVRAALVFALSSGFPPDWFETTRALLASWRRFWPLALWNEIPSEIALPVARTRRGKRQLLAVSALGQGGREFGVAVYDELEDFHRLWSEGTMKGKSRSLLAAPEALKDVFEPLGVPCPVLVPVSGMRPRDATEDDVQLVAGTMELLAGLLERKASFSLGEGDVLELVKQPADEPPAKPKRAPRKRRS